MEIGVWAKIIWDFKIMASLAFIFVFYWQKSNTLPKTHLLPIADKSLSDVC